MAKKANDKRQHQRVEARLAMQLAEDTLGDALVTTESLNISRGGVYCESPEYLAPLSKVALTVILPVFGPAERSSMLRTEGVVVRCEPLPSLRGRKRYQLACCFTGLDGETRKLLDEFVTWRAVRGRTAVPTRKASSRKSVVGKTKAARPAVRSKAAKRATPARTTRSAAKKVAGKRAPLKRTGPAKKQK